MSSHVVLCSQSFGGIAILDLQESGAAVAGTAALRGGACRIDANLQATRSGDRLVGTAVDGAMTAGFSGTLEGEDLRVTFEVFSDGRGSIPGGLAEVRRE
jgi:hypothetical protein